MDKKFACLTFSETKQQFISNKIINMLPQKIKDWYILKNNLFLIADVRLLEATGYKVVLPIQKKQNAEITKYIIERTLYELTELEVVIALLPKDLQELEFESNIILADAKRLMPFFIIKASKKALKKENKELKKADYLIIDSDNDMTEILIHLTYNHINFLSVMTQRPDYFDIITEKIYSENGLNIQIISLDNKAALNNADVIINTSTEKLKFDYLFARNSIYFDVAKNNSQLACKREDMQVINGLEFRNGEGYIKLSELEMPLFILSKSYKKYVSGRFNLYDLEEITSHLMQLNIPITSFT